MTSSCAFYRRWVHALVTTAAVAGGCLVGTGPAAAADTFTDKGVLRLQLGQTAIGDHVPNRFAYQLTQGGALSDQQRFTITNKCQAGFVATDPQLVTVEGSPYPLGIGPTSLGVFDNAKGTDCYRISASKGEFIKVRLGKDIKAKGANTISKLELDLELKQDAVFELWVTRGGTRLAKPFVLESGRMRGSTPDGYAQERPSQCTGASDSGPDAGILDNCRWILAFNSNTIGDGFDLVATNGEGSLEGGGDYGPSAYANNSLVYLTDAIVGVLGCQLPSGADRSAFTPAIVNPVNGATCQVTRIDTGSVGGPACVTNVSYLMRTFGKGCEIVKYSNEQLAAILDVTFPPESWQALPVLSSDGVTGEPIPARTWVRFGTDTTKYYPDRCIGTLLVDSIGNQTIAEVLTSGTGFYDFMPATAVKEWACILEDETIYIGNSPDPTRAQMQIRQKILFWGDFLGGRW